MDSFWKLLAKMGIGRVAPASENPADYPRAVEITDDAALLLHARLQMDSDAAQKAAGRLDAALARMHATKAELFVRLREIYPSVTPWDTPGCGYRSWNGRVYYVGWDQEPEG